MIFHGRMPAPIFALGDAPVFPARICDRRKRKHRPGSWAENASTPKGQHPKQAHEPVFAISPLRESISIAHAAGQ
jgi:hypothetical protein